MTIERAAYIIAAELLQSENQQWRVDDKVRAAVERAVENLSHETIFGEPPSWDYTTEWRDIPPDGKIPVHGVMIKDGKYRIIRVYRRKP